MDFLTIRNLEVFSRCEVFEGENRLGQKFSLDLLLYLDTRTAGITDDIAYSVDYAKVCHFVSAFMRGHAFRLIETAAERLAEDILIEYPEVSKILLTVKKPWAPVGLPIEEVSVTIERGWHRVYLAMGSNMGDREAYINNAIKILGENDRIRIGKKSTLIETEPYGMVRQDKFLNNCVELYTMHSPMELLTFCQNLEKMAGRVKTEHWGPRPLDIDILLYDNDVVDMPDLTIPHYDMENRTFVLEPLCEIAPFIRNPVSRKTASQMLKDLTGK